MDAPSGESRVLGIVVVPAGFESSTPIGGLAPLLRHVLALQSAGVSQVAILGDGATPVDPRIAIPISHWLEAHDRALVVRADVTSHRQVPARLLASADFENDAITRIGNDDAALFATRSDATEGVVDALRDGRPVVPARTLPLIPGVSAEFVVRAGTASERTRATFAHLVSLRKPTSGYFERLYMRPMSMWITWALCRTRVTPNAMTVVTFLLGLGSALLVALPDVQTNRAGALLHLFMRVVDCVDGELSRLRYQGSKLGAWLDTVGDGIAMAAFVAALGYRLGTMGSPYAVVGYVGAAAWMIVQAFEWRGAYLADTGGTVQSIEWGHRSSEPTLVERWIGRVELLLRIDAISTYYGLLVLAGALAPLVIGHTVLSVAAAAYYATQIGKLSSARAS